MVVIVGDGHFEPVCWQIYIELLSTGQLAVAIAASRDLDPGVTRRPKPMGFGKASIGTFEFYSDLAATDTDDFGSKFGIEPAVLLGDTEAGRIGFGQHVKDLPGEFQIFARRDGGFLRSCEYEVCRKKRRQQTRYWKKHFMHIHSILPLLLGFLVQLLLLIAGDIPEPYFSAVNTARTM